ncbi:MAG: calcium-binding protein [Hormoscilla sp. GM102CHS1]|nr:calcium-binding protein [Hormoscilla sp. GM102CHS1]
MAVVEFEPESDEGSELIATTGDTLMGGAGDETLNAASGGGSNWLFGREGNDVLLAGSNDRLIGGPGADQLFVGRGRAVLHGGAGADGFWIVDGELPEQVNVVRDFQHVSSLLGIRGLTPETVRSLRVLQVNENTLIQIEGENVALLRNTKYICKIIFIFLVVNFREFSSMKAL